MGIRIFLNLVSRAGCFNTIQAGLAYNLKKNYDLFVHTELIPDYMKTKVFEDVKCILKTFENTEPDRDELQKSFLYGTRYFIKTSDKLDKERDVPINELHKENKQASDDIYFSDDESEN